MASWDNFCYVDVLANLEPVLEVTKLRYAFSFYFCEGKREEIYDLQIGKHQLAKTPHNFILPKHTHTHTHKQ